MPNQTDNYGLNDYAVGEGSWDHSDLVQDAEINHPLVARRVTAISELKT